MIWDLRLEIWDLRLFEIWDLRLEISDFGFQILNFGFQILNFRFWISDFGISGFGFQVSDLRFKTFFKCLISDSDFRFKFKGVDILASAPACLKLLLLNTPLDLGLDWSLKNNGSS